MKNLVELFKKLLAYTNTPHGRKIAQHVLAAAYIEVKVATPTEIDDAVVKKLFQALDGDPAWLEF